MKGKNAAEV